MADQLRLVVVTPEKPLLDESVTALRFPLYDGQIGVLPGRAPWWVAWATANWC